jgi:hypothetical protein
MREVGCQRLQARGQRQDAGDKERGTPDSRLSTPDSKTEGAMGKDTRVTVDLKGEELYRAVKAAAIDRNASVSDIVCQAIKDWLVREEEKEDLEAYREVKDEPSRPLDEFLAEIGEVRSELATGD